MHDIIFENYAANKQTFIIPLTFPDINHAADVIERIGYGGDLWELRVDLLSPEPGPLPAVNLPRPAYVEAQVRALQAMSRLPILFTIRTKLQGGKFPDDAVDQARDLMLLAVACGIQYLDVEVEWPKALLGEITAKKDKTKVVASYHSWTGDIRWTSQELRTRFEAANDFGDVVKLSIQSTGVEDCYELGLFVRDYKLKHTKPLLAVGMGAAGQLSRITSPISLVTHPLIPFPSAPGQLSLAQVHQARHLMGLLQRKEFDVLGGSASAKAVVAAMTDGFQELGLPHVCKLVDGATCTSQDALDMPSNAKDAEAALVAQFTRWTGRPAPASVMIATWNRTRGR